VAVDVREPHLTGADGLRAAYEAKARAELADAGALVKAPPGSWTGHVIKPRIAFLIARAGAATASVLPDRVAEAAAKAAEALGAGGETFAISTRPVPDAPEGENARRLRLALEAVDPLVAIALDAASAADLAAAFGLPDLPPGRPVRAFGRTVGAVGDFAASLDDDALKASSWTAMKAIARAAGLKAKGRPKAPPLDQQEPGGA
jgi:hypothetical protein